MHPAMMNRRDLSNVRLCVDYSFLNSPVQINGEAIENIGPDWRRAIGSESYGGVAAIPRAIQHIPYIYISFCRDTRCVAITTQTTKFTIRARVFARAFRTHV